MKKKKKKKNVKNYKKKKRNSKRCNFGEILDFEYLKSFEKKTIVLQSSLIKSRIYTIKPHKF